jgi:hypothetical protein
MLLGPIVNPILVTLLVDLRPKAIVLVLLTTTASAAATPELLGIRPSGLPILEGNLTIKLSC